MQHCTKLPLLLYNIKKYTENPTEKQQIADSIQKVEASLRKFCLFVWPIFTMNIQSRSASASQQNAIQMAFHWRADVGLVQYAGWEFA